MDGWMDGWMGSMMDDDLALLLLPCVCCCCCRCRGAVLLLLPLCFPLRRCAALLAASRSLTRSSPPTACSKKAESLSASPQDSLAPSRVTRAVLDIIFTSASWPCVCLNYQ